MAAPAVMLEFEINWKPSSWNDRYRFVFVRSQNRQQAQGPIQLDLFIPYEYGYDFEVIVTNKSLSARKALSFHNGRGAQKGVFAELKSQTQTDYMPTRRKTGNQVYLLSAVLAHNLNQEMHMLCYEQERNTRKNVHHCGDSNNWAPSGANLSSVPDGSPDHAANSR